MNKKSLLKRFSMAFVALAMMLTSSISVFAATTPRYANNYYLAEGIGHIDYYIDSSASGYTTQITNAANNWVNTGFGYNPIYMYRTYNSNASNMDIFVASGNQQMLMEQRGQDSTTVHVDVRTSGHVNVNPTQSFWDYGIIYLNPECTAYYSDAWKQGCIAHEMGHVMGLDDNWSTTDSVMYPVTSSRRNTVGKADHDGINAMY